MAAEPNDANGAGEQPAYVIEKARSSRSKCKGCRKAIQKDKLRLGVLIEGPFGAGYLWHHLNCAAKRRFDQVVEAYAAYGDAPDLDLPPLESLKKEVEAAAEKKAKQKTVPYVEIAPTGRSKCRVCDEAIEKEAPRVALLRSVEFYGQTRTGPINVHPECVPSALEAPDNATEADGLAEALRANSEGVDAKVIEETILRAVPGA